MIDIPRILEEHAQEKLTKILQELMLRIAANNRAMADDEYKSLVNGLTQAANIQNKNQEFSRDKMEELRAMTNLGINRTR